MSTARAPLTDTARSNGRPPEPQTEAPWIGLSFYTEADAALFYGRDSERQVIMGNLRASRLTLLYAQSGVGKSSLLRAGVAARLREIARGSLAGSGAAPQVPVVFSAWKDDPSQELIDEILSATNALLGESASQLDLPRDSLKSAIDVAVLALERAVASDGSERMGSSLLIILDQFEEYFLYRARESRVERFADELADCINDPNVRANFLISIREDAYSALGDLLRGRMSNVYSNYLHLEYLDGKSARTAIEKPLAYVNSLRPEEARMSIEPGLVEAVLEQVQRDPDEQPADKEEAGPRRVEIATPYLQLVMTALWQRERDLDSRILRLSTLEELRGAENIVARHLRQALDGLRPADRELAVDMLHHLVTPSGTKVALEVADLSAYTDHPADRVLRILNGLAGASRILREVPPAPGKAGEDDRCRRFEIYHDVLAGPINDAVSISTTERLKREKQAAEQRARQEQKRARRFRALAVGALVLLAVAVAGAVVAVVETHRAHSAELTSRSQEFAAAAQAGLLSGDLQRGVLLGVQAYRSRRTPEARDALISALEPTQDMAGYLTAQKGQVSGVAYSPDGTTLASSANRTVVLWNTATAEPKATVIGHPAQVTGVAFSPDGRTVASSDAAGQVFVSDAQSPTQKRVLRGSHGPIETVTYSPRETLLATAQQDGTASLWDPASGRLLRTVRVSHDDAVYGIAFSPDGRTLVTGSGRSVALWRTADGRRLRVIHTGSVVNAVAVSPDGSLLAVATGASVTEYGMQNGKVQRDLDPHAGPVMTVAFTVNGRMLAAGTAGDASAAATAAIWDPHSGDLLKVISAPNELFAINALAFSPDGDTLASGGTSSAGTDGSLILWNAHPAPGFRILRVPTGAVHGVAVSPDGTYLAATGTAQEIVVWNTRTGTKMTLPLGADGEAVAFSPDGRTLAAASDDGLITLWNTATGHRLRSLSSQQPVFAIAFSPTGRLLASGGGDQRVTIWSVGSGRRMRELTGDTDQINAVAFSPDGTEVASGGNDDLINVWDVASAHRRLTLTATRPVDAVAFSPHGHLLASAGADELVSLWNLSTGELVGAPFAGQQDNITSLAFSHGGRDLASGSGDGSALVWDLRTGLGVPVSGQTGAILSVAFTPDDRTVVTGAANGTVTLAPVPGGMSAVAISRRLCGLVHRNLTRAEWREFIPDEPYQRTCQS